MSYKCARVSTLRKENVMKNISRMIVVLVVALTAMSYAGVETWDGGHGSANAWYANLNWLDDTAPGDGDSLVFTGTTRLSHTSYGTDGDGDLQIVGITFDAAAGSFVIANGGGGTIMLQGNITNESSNLQTINFPFQLNGGNRTIDTASGDITIGGVISQDVGGRQLIVDGDGTLTLSAANTYSGTTRMGENGVSGDSATRTIRVEHDNALGTGGLAFERSGVLELGADGLNVSTFLGVYNWSGGTRKIRLDEPGSISAALSGNVWNQRTSVGTFVVEVETNDTLTMSGYFYKTGGGGGGGLTKTGDGTLVLTGDSASPGSGDPEHGPTRIQVGTLQLGDGGAAGTLNTSENLSISAGATFAVKQSDTVTQGTDFTAAAISGDGGFTQAGSGKTVLNVANTYAGNTTISAGTLALSGAGTLGSGSYAGDISNSGTFKYNSPEDQELSGTISGSGTLNMVHNTSTLTLSGTGNTIGALNAAGGNLVLSGSSDTTVSDRIYVANSGVEDGGSGTLTVQDSAVLSVEDLFLVGNETGKNGTVNQTGGAVNLTGAGANDIRIGHWPSLTATYTLSSGTLNALNTRFILGWDGTGILNVDGGTANLKGLACGVGNNGARAGTVTLGGGTLNIGSDGMYQEINGTINLNSGTLGALAGWSSTMAMTLGGSVDIDTTGGDIALSGALTGTGGFAKEGSGTLTLSNAGNTYNGATTVDAGTLTLNSTESWNGGTIPSSAITVNSGGTLEVANASNLHDDQAITVNGGTLNISIGSADHGENYVNDLTLNSGALLSGNAPRVGYLVDPTWTVGGTSASTISAQLQLVNDVDVSGVRQFTLDVGDATSDANVDLTITGAIADYATHRGEDLVKAGAGTLKLSGANTYSGDTIINAGVLRLASGGSLNTATTVRLASSAKMELDSGINQTVYELYFDGVRQVQGTWGATGSGAGSIDDTRFAGTGILTVTKGSATLFRFK
jgi:fibronectin-binding autotransporter adhesin